MRDDGVVAAAIRAARYADAVMRRTATGGDMQSYWDWYSDSHPEGVHPNAIYDFAHWYRKHIDPTADRQQVYDFAKDDAFAKGIPQQFSNWGKPTIYRGEIVPNTGQWWNHDFSDPEHDELMGEWEDRIGSPDDQKSKGGIGIGIGPEGEAVTYRPLPISQPKGHNGEGFDPDENPTPFDPRIPLAGGEEGFDPDEHQDPFDPRLIGAGKQAGFGYDPSNPEHEGEWESGHQSLPGDPTPEDYQRAKDWKNQLSDAHLKWFDDDDDAADKDFANYSRDPKKYTTLPLPQERMPSQGWNPDKIQDPFDPRLIGASRRHAVGEGYGGSWHEEHYDENGDYVGPHWPQDMSHHLDGNPDQAPYSAGYHAARHPAFVNSEDPLGVAQSVWTNAGGDLTGSMDFSSFQDGWMDSVNGIPHMWLQPEAHQAYLEKGDHLRRFNPKRRREHEDSVRSGTVPYIDPDDTVDPFDPRLIGAGKRTARDVPEGEDWEAEERRLERHMRDNPELYEAANYPFDELGSYNGTRWPEDLSHHLHADPGIASYNAGYAAYQHPAFADHDSPLHAAKEAWYQAGGRDLNPQNGTSFEDGYLDAEGEIPHRFRDAEGYEGWRAERGEEMPNPVGDAYADWNPDDKQDPFDPRLIGASRRTARDEDLVLPPDAPHQEWRPRYRYDHRPTVWQWHPPFGETHIKYHIYRLGGGRNPIIWGANHHGTYQGMETIDSPYGEDKGSITCPLYSNGHEPDQLGRFRTPEQAKAAAEKHFADTYGRHQKMDGLNLDQVMRDHGDRPRAETGLGEDEDYGHIFGMLRQAGWEMADIVRLAGDGMSWEDTMAHIDQVLAEGEHGHSSAPGDCPLCGSFDEDLSHRDGICESCYQDHLDEGKQPPRWPEYQ